VCREIDDTVFVKFCSFDAGLGGIGAGDKVLWVGMDSGGDLFQFIGGFGQRMPRATAISATTLVFCAIC
jgi:hypothetical protein